MAHSEKIENFYRLWVSEVDKILSGYIYDENEVVNPVRYMFFQYLSLLEKLIGNQLEEIEKIHLLYGLRGVGKTTLLAQIYYAPKLIPFNKKEDFKHIIFQNYEKIYIDVSRLIAEDISLIEFFHYYQEVNNLRFVELKKKLLILLDEVHYDEKWGLFLKNLFDSTKHHRNILVIATGSSALKIKLNPDLIRRSQLKELFPLKFNEYILLKYNIPFQEIPSEELIEILLKKNAKEAFQFYKKQERTINTYFSKLPPYVEQDYLYTGGFPFVLKKKNQKPFLYELIAGIVDKLIIKDLLEMKNFKSFTLSKIYDLIYLIANADSTNMTKLSRTLNLDYRTLRDVLDALIQSGVLIEIKSYSERHARVKKPTKFLFISPSLRVSLLKGILPVEIKGRILEDYLAFLFSKVFREKENQLGNIEVLYDSSNGGADFILRINNKKKILIEVGFHKGNEAIKQIEETNKITKGYDLGIITSPNMNLEILNNQKIIKLPLKFFLLM